VEAAAQLFSLMAWLKGVDSPADALSSAGEVQNPVSSFCSSISGRLIAFSFNGLQTEKFLLDAYKKPSVRDLDRKTQLHGQNQWKRKSKPVKIADIGIISWIPNEVSAGVFRRRSVADPRCCGMPHSPKHKRTSGVAAFSARSSRSGLPRTPRGENPHD
jgi:hypothetical protein